MAWSLQARLQAQGSPPFTPGAPSEPARSRGGARLRLSCAPEDPEKLLGGTSGGWIAPHAASSSMPPSRGLYVYARQRLCLCVCVSLSLSLSLSLPAHLGLELGATLSASISVNPQVFTFADKYTDTLCLLLSDCGSFFC